MATDHRAAPLSTRERSHVAGVLEMYRQGWFPMLDEDGRRVNWVQPEMRGIIPLDDRFRVSRSLRQRVKSGRFRVVVDTAFGEVIRACAEPGRGGTWLHPDIIETFDLLHRAGHAHSVEAWLETPGGGRTLVGGLYGLQLGGVFCGESMFSRPASGGTDASKVCLVHLVERLRARGFALLDAQLTNDHLEQFGLFEMPREAYLETLDAHADDAVRFADTAA